MIDVQNGHNLLGIWELTRKCGARRTVGRSPISVWQHQNRGATRIRATPRENGMAPLVIFTEGLANIAEQSLPKVRRHFGRSVADAQMDGQLWPCLARLQFKYHAARPASRLSE